MADFLVPECSAENVVVYDTDNRRRLHTMLDIATRLHEQKWQVHVFASINGEAYEKISAKVRQYVPLEKDDIEELFDAASRDRIAVVIDGLLTSAGVQMRRLLRRKDIFVAVTTCAKDVRGDHRYNRLCTPGKGWRLREEPKDFTVIEAKSAPTQTPGWFGWLW